MLRREAIPFAVRRIRLLIRDLRVDRNAPDIAALSSIESPERFVWEMLPHAARTFSACIALLPRRIALPAAVAYLYCRCLDTYEDLVEDHGAKIRALEGFAQRLVAGASPQPATLIDPAAAVDARDAAHILLVNRCSLVDRVFAGFDPQTRSIVVDLVQGMSEGMIWSSAVFRAQAGVLTGSEQLRRYCEYVLGLPTVFTARLMKLHYQASDELDEDHREDALRAGEMVQLANITRDIEKDLRRGIAYHPDLSSDLGGDAAQDAACRERVRHVRLEFLIRALRLVPAYRRFVERFQFSPVSFGRASAILMLRFTDRHYRQCAERVGRQAWDGPRSSLSVIVRSIPAIFSQSFANRRLERFERYFLEFVRGWEDETGNWAEPSLSL